LCKGTLNHEEVYFIRKENIPKETLEQLNKDGLIITVEYQ